MAEKKEDSDAGIAKPEDEKPVNEVLGDVGKFSYIGAVSITIGLMYPGEWHRCVKITNHRMKQRFAFRMHCTPLQSRLTSILLTDLNQMFKGYTSTYRAIRPIKR